MPIKQHIRPTIIAAFLCACAAPAARPATNAGSSRYPGTCILAGIDQVTAPVDQVGDSVALVARYRYGESSSAAQGPWALQFQVARARESDLRLHLESHPNVMCDPDTAPGAAARLDVPPFEGQHGQPLD